MRDLRNSIPQLRHLYSHSLHHLLGWVLQEWDFLCCVSAVLSCLHLSDFVYLMHGHFYSGKWSL